ncbi:MAG: ABC transporter permease [Bradymonadia bacterium]
MNRFWRLMGASSRRLLSGVLLLVGASFVIYATVRAAPGDAIDAISPPGTDPEIKAKLAAEFGLDRDIVSGYGHWLLRSTSGDFGQSLVFETGAEVLDVVLPAFGRTLLLSVLALLACLTVALVWAIIAGQPGPIGRGITSLLYVITAAPSFIAAFFFAQITNYLVFTHRIQEGFDPPAWYPLFWETEGKSLMPYVFAGGVLMVADGMLMDTFNAVRAELLRLQGSQFIAAVRAKGAGTVRHIARNLIVPLVSAYAARLPLILSGAVIVERIFALNGAGYVLFESAKFRDFPVVVAVSVCFTVTIIVVNVIADLVRAAVDPREAAHGG